MLKSALQLMKQIYTMPFPVNIWMYLLSGVNMACIFFLTHIEAQLTFAVFMFSFFFMLFLYRRYNFTRILGLAHVLWLGLVPWLATRLSSVESGSLVYYWMLLLIGTNTISVLLDAWDVIRYAQGDRGRV